MPNKKKGRTEGYVDEISEKFARDLCYRVFTRSSIPSAQMWIYRLQTRHYWKDIILWDHKVIPCVQTHIYWFHYRWWLMTPRNIFWKFKRVPIEYWLNLPIFSWYSSTEWVFPLNGRGSNPVSDLLKKFSMMAKANEEEIVECRLLWNGLLSPKSKGWGIDPGGTIGQEKPDMIKKLAIKMRKWYFRVNTGAKEELQIDLENKLAQKASTREQLEQEIENALYCNDSVRSPASPRYDPYICQSYRSVCSYGYFRAVAFVSLLRRPLHLRLFSFDYLLLIDLISQV